MVGIAQVVFWSSLVMVAYPYVIYPGVVSLIARLRRRGGEAAGAVDEPAEWPRISITVPAYNEADSIAATLDNLVAMDYPADRREILVVSDASTDGTDDIVRTYEDRGVSLLRMPTRSGKTAAENAAAERLTGDIVVNTDASVRIARTGIKDLIRQFEDPGVGLASGRDVSVGTESEDAGAGEARYVGFEMWLRSRETKARSIVGASGCYYAIRPHLHRVVLPSWLSRDFAAALITVRNGYRAVSVNEAVCYVPRSRSLRAEYRRKVRTITRGMETLGHLRSMLNPLRYPLFSWMLFSHKVARWMVPWAGALALLASAVLAPTMLLPRLFLAAGVTGLLVGAIGWARADRGGLPRWVSVPAYVLLGSTAAMAAVLHAARGRREPMWEPTRRRTIAGEA